MGAGNGAGDRGRSILRRPPGGRGVPRERRRCRPARSADIGVSLGLGRERFHGLGGGGEAAISVAALADAGYTVDMTKATSVVPGNAQAAVDHASDVVPAKPRRLPREG